METSVQCLVPISLPKRPVRSNPFSRWLFGDSGDGESGEQRVHPWWMVMWLTGMDYFSDLGFQPGMALLAAGILSPFATLFLVAVTLFGALPIYMQVSRRSYTGQGSIAMLGKLIPGWAGKLAVLVLIGFAATDFVITMTLSAADAARHLIANPYAQPFLQSADVTVTIVLLALLAGVFLLGFSEAIRLAIFIGLPYLVLNVIVIAAGFREVWLKPELFSNWHLSLAALGSWRTNLIASFIMFPQLVLGLSGFETGVSVMPLIKAEPPDAPGEAPRNRIKATWKLLSVVSLIMSVMLIGSSLVTTLLISKHDYQLGGVADGRALAFLAHNLLGNVFGSMYDIFSILILWFAGASAMAGLLNLIPRYLPRFGMAPHWVEYMRPLVLLLFGIDLLITWIFHANVDAQGGAFATGLLVLFLSGAVAAALSFWHDSKILSVYFWGVTIIFAYTLFMNVRERPDGIIIGSCFIVTILITSAFSRYHRATELRVESVSLADEESARLWSEMLGKKVNIIPVHGTGGRARHHKADEMKKHFKIEGPLAFLHVYLRDDRSEFSSALLVKVQRRGDDYIIEASGAVAVANAIAYLSEMLHPLSIIVDLTRRNPMERAFQYLFWGEGETGLMVYEILRRHWEERFPLEKRPVIFLTSE